MELPSTISLVDFAKAMQEQDLSHVPPEKRAQARYEHFVRVMFHSMSGADRAKAIEHNMERARSASRKSKLILP